VAGTSGTGTAGASPERWPYLLYFVRYSSPLGGIAVDDRFVYFNYGDQRFMRIHKDGTGEMEELVRCDCEQFDIVADGGYVYILGSLGPHLVRVHGADKTETRLELLWSHAQRGGLMVDETYIYTVMPGCAAITRINKQTFTFDPDADVMYIDGVNLPSTPGSTELARAGSRLVCGSPSTIFVIEEWGGPARIVHDGFAEDGLWGLAAAGESQAFWMEGQFTTGSRRLGRIELPAGVPERIQIDATATNRRLLHVPELGRLVWGGGHGYDNGLQTYEVGTSSLGSTLTFATVSDVASDGEAIYATASSRPGPDVRTSNDIGVWIARVPFPEVARE
jgi:hypothetical protein